MQNLPRHLRARATLAAVLALVLPALALPALAAPARRPPAAVAGAAFPATELIDDFGGRRGRLAPDWFGSEGLRGYRIMRGKVEVMRGGPIYWRRAIFGADQEAYLTLTAIDPRSSRQGLLLKVQRNNWRRGAVAVLYDAPAQQVVVASITYGARSWTTLARLDQALSSGAVLGARVRDDGQVQVFVGGELIGTAEAGPSFGDVGGRVGVWFAGGQRATFDNFGGGDVPST